MNFKCPSIVAAVVVSLALSLSAGEFRVLTNSSGKKIKAELLSKSNGKITFKIRNSRKKYTVDISSLSAADQEFLEDWVPEGSEAKEDDAGADAEDKAEEDEDLTSNGPKSLYPKTKSEIRDEIREILKGKGADKKSSEEQKATNMTQCVSLPV